MRLLGLRESDERKLEVQWRMLLRYLVEELGPRRFLEYLQGCKGGLVFAPFDGALFGRVYGQIVFSNIVIPHELFQS